MSAAGQFLLPSDLELALVATFAELYVGGACSCVAPMGSEVDGWEGISLWSVEMQRRFLVGRSDSILSSANW